MQPPATRLSVSARQAWRTVQALVWMVGAGMVLALIAWPTVGIHAFWNVLIPVAPALVVFAPGLWRNICPLASSALFARHMGASSRRRISHEWQGRLLLIGAVILFTVVPLRHVVLDTSGPATAVTLLILAAAAVTMGVFFEWKSGWCSGLCPVHPVERLYGSTPAFDLPNAHCDSCQSCVQPCPDSTPNLTPLTSSKGWTRRAAGLLIVGAFPGFIWGWFQVPDWSAGEGWLHLATAYGQPLLGAAVTLVLYLVVESFTPWERRDLLVRAFAAGAVACYYWFRLPMLFGFGPHPGDGMLVDLTGTLPGWFPLASRLTTTAVFLWWLVIRRPVLRSWARRPSFATS